MALGLGIHTAPLTTPLKWKPTDGSLNSELLFWFKNNTGVSAAAWLDQSDNGNDATQSTSGRQPTVSEGGLLFDGSDDRLALDSTISIAASNDFTLCIAVKMNNDNDNTIITGAADKIVLDSTTRIAATVTDDGDQVQILMNSLHSLFTAAASEKIWLVIQRSDAGVFFVTNSKGRPVVASGDSTGSLTLNTIGGAGSDFFDGIILEMFMYSRILTKLELDNAEDYLGYKFNIS